MNEVVNYKQLKDVFMYYVPVGGGGSILGLLLLSLIIWKPQILKWAIIIGLFCAISNFIIELIQDLTYKW